MLWARGLWVECFWFVRRGDGAGPSENRGWAGQIAGRGALQRSQMLSFRRFRVRGGFSGRCRGFVGGRTF